MKFQYTKIRQGHVLVCTLTKREGFNRRELEMLSEPPEGIMKAISFNEESLTVVFDANKCIPLNTYLSKNIMTGEEVLAIARQLITIMNNLEESRMTVQKLVPDMKNAFYNVNKRMLELVFCPVQNNYSPLESKQIFSFMLGIAETARLSGSNEKIKAFSRFVRQQQTFSAAATADFLDENIGEVTSVLSSTEALNPPVTVSLVSSDTSFGRSPEEVPAPPGPAPVSAGAFIRNEKTGKDFPITSRNCVIGRVGIDGSGVKVAPDLAVTKNKRVGKRHALIFCDGKNYYIADLASKNGTRVNGWPLPSGYDLAAMRFNGIYARLQNGTRIELAGEYFTFFIN
ncbi:MAG: FHA domain-containing protein [Ruminococcus sp.]|nr:FHA domain-containing protein [Ruminococcus sp.]